MNTNKRILNNFKLKNLGIYSYNEVVLFIHSDSTFFRSEGSGKRTRVMVKHADRSVLALVNSVGRHPERSRGVSCIAHLNFADDLSTTLEMTMEDRDDDGRSR